MEIKEVKTVSKEVVVSTVCDRCGKEVEDGEFERGKYFRFDLDVSDGTCFPGDVNTDTYRIDCCRSCFLNVLKPALETTGFKFQFKDRWGL